MSDAKAGNAKIAATKVKKKRLFIGHACRMRFGVFNNFHWFYEHRREITDNVAD